MKTSALLIPLTLAAILTAPINAYELHDYKWRSATMTFHVDIPGRGGLWNRAFEEAMERWNQATIFTFESRRIYEDPCDLGDWESGVGFASDICGDSFGPSGTSLAVTRNWVIGSSTQVASNITFNSDYSWRVYDGPNSYDPDFKRIAVHELGHTLGLAHVGEYDRSIMTPSVDDIIRPQADDIAGVLALYGAATTPSPPNDDFSDAIRVDDNLSGRVTGSNVNASTESEETGLGSKSVWWGWRAPATGRLTVDTTGSDFDTVLGVYTGTWPFLSTLRLVVENDDTNGGQQSRVELDATEEKIYVFRVAGYNGSTGNIVLNWNLEVPPQITRRDKYIFPQFAFGGGWQSTLMGLGPHRDTSCTFSAQGRYIETNGPQGVELDLSFNNTWRILKTTAPPSQEASSGMAVLDCDKEVLASVLFSLRVNGALVGEALVEPAEEIAAVDRAYFIADHRGGGRLALALANPSNHPLPVRVRLSDSRNSPPSAVNTTVDIPANSAKSFFLDELGTIPEDHVGLVRIWAGRAEGRSVYAIGLKVTGSVFTTIPAMVVR